MKRLRKDLGPFDVYAVSTGALSGCGFFLLPGIAAAYTGPSVVLACLVSAAFAVPAMLSLVEPCTAMPRSGGPYCFPDRLTVVGDPEGIAALRSRYAEDASVARPAG